MRGSRVVRAVLCFAAVGGSAAAAPFAGAPSADDGFASAVAFVQRYCATCHGAEREEGLPRLDDLRAPDSREESARWEAAVLAVRDHLMPPVGAPQPDDLERSALWATWSAARGGAAVRRSTGLRRLERHEYRHTLEDLLGIDTAVLDPTAEFPAEPAGSGPHAGRSDPVISEPLLEGYLTAAREVVQRVRCFRPRPTPVTLTRAGPFHTARSELGNFATTTRWSDPRRPYFFDRYRPDSGKPFTELRFLGERGGSAPFLPMALGAKERGRYTVRVLASAHQRDADGSWFGLDHRPGDPLELQLAVVRHDELDELSRVVARTEVLDEEPSWFEFSVFLEAGTEPELRLGNVGSEVREVLKALQRSAPAEHPQFESFRDRRPSDPAVAAGLLALYPGPSLRLHEMQVQGPLWEEWPPRGHRVLYGDLPERPTGPAALVQLLRFAALAFRRPLFVEERADLERAMRAALKEGCTVPDALEIGFQVVLCSPGFLFRDESSSPLGDHALASRLSYFLIASMPDEALRRLADRGALGDREVLLAEARRLLEDPRSDRFLDAFLGDWLSLSSIDQSPPADGFREFHRESIHEHMLAETRAFLRDAIDRNLSLFELVDSDHSFLNRPLAAYYGLEALEGLELRRVTLPKGGRGGLLGQASLLTASANGVDTSPVRRGRFVLERLLGETVPPPPADTPALSADTRDARSVRERLERHRADPACAVCHDRLDPLGLPLEEFDAVGRIRTSDAWGEAIEATGRLADGREVQGLSGLRELLLERADGVRLALVRRLLEFATGRSLGDEDEVCAAAIAEHSRTSGDGLRDLVLAVVDSEAFRR